MDGQLDTPPYGTVEEGKNDFLMTPTNALLSVLIDVSPVILNGIPMKVGLEPLFNTSLDVLISVLLDVLTNALVDAPAAAFPGGPYYAPLKSTPDAMTLLHFPQDARSQAQIASRSKIPVEVAAY